MLRQSQILEVLGVSRTTFYRLRRDTDFPKPVRMLGLLRWRKDEVQAWIDSQ